MVLSRHFGIAGFKENVVDLAVSGHDAVHQVIQIALLWFLSLLFFSKGANAARSVSLDRYGRLPSRGDGRAPSDAGDSPV